MTDPIPDPTHPDFHDGDEAFAPTPVGDDVGDIGPDGPPGPAPEPGDPAGADAGD
jgi:hypothetical protein